MRNMTVVVLGAIALLAMLNGCTRNPQFAAYTSNSQWVLIGLLGDNNSLAIFHHIPSGKNSEFKGFINGEDSSGSRWVIRNKESLALIQIRPDGKITRKDLPVVPGITEGHGVEFAFGPGPDQITAGVPQQGADLVFYCLTFGQSQWNHAKPTPDVQSSTRHLDLDFSSGYPKSPKDGSNSKIRVITQSESKEGTEIRVFRIDSPDGKSFVTLKVKKDHPVLWFPDFMFYRECEFSVTDIASGKTRIISNQFGEILLDRIDALRSNILPLWCSYRVPNAG
jgi:hypothetical protein